VGVEAGLLEGVGDHGGVGEQVLADLPAEGGQLLGPVADGVEVQGEAGVDLVDEPVDQVRLATDMGIEGGGGDPQAVGQAAHGQGPGAVLLQQGQGFPGLLVGAWAVGYGTSLGELALMGFITGIPLGAAQAYLLRDRVANAWVWAAAMPLLWALGWTVTTAGGIDVDRQFAVFGAYGAITFMALSGILLDRLRGPVTGQEAMMHECQRRPVAHGHVRSGPHGS
jgi:hypothetical protein